MTSIINHQGRLVRTHLAPVLGIMFGVLASACSDRTPTSAKGDPSTLPSTIQVTPGGAIMAVGDTLTLKAALTSLDGKPLADLSGVTFTSLAPKKMSVTSQGLVTALDSSSQPVGVAVSVQRNLNTVADTVKMFITLTRDVPQAFRMELDTSDTDLLGDTVGVAYGTWINAYVPLASGDTIFTVPALYTTSTPTSYVSTYGFDSYFTSMAYGHVTVRGSILVYGTTYSDSLQYVVTYPHYGYIGWDPNSSAWFYPSTLQVLVRAGGYVYWYNWNSTLSNAITFDDPSAAGSYQGGASGNIPAFSGTRIFRQFDKPGTYKWHSGTQTGTVIVMPNS